MRVLFTGGSGFIGTNAIAAFAEQGHTVFNLSLHPPLDSAQNGHWHFGDILNPDKTLAAFQTFQPDWVIHLAARADCDENTTVEKGYGANTDGTKHVLAAIKKTPSVQRVIITSTQFVCGPGRLPKHDEDYFPVTVYGQSKVVTEQLTRSANLACCWTITRPTNIWGPWHLRYKREFWRALQSGLYLHPGGRPVIRSYGYVKNIVHQMQRIFELPAEVVSGRTLYLGDPPADILRWVDGFSVALTDRPARVVPRMVMRTLALLGDVPTLLTGKPFLINSSRYRSMITDYHTPMKPSFDLLGQSPYSMEAGISETVRWLRAYKGRERQAGGA